MPTASEIRARHLDRESLAKRVSDAIRNGIINGDYEMGQRLRETEFSATFAVSNSVIREALHILQGEGLVITDPYRGRSVFSIDKTEADRLVLMRTSMEALAAYLAAKQLDDASTQAISDAATRIRTTAPGSFAEWVSLELNFHRAVWEAAHSEMLCRQLNQLIVCSLSLSTVRFVKLGPALDHIVNGASKWETPENDQGHQKVTQAILGGAPEIAREHMILHLMGSPSLWKLRHEYFHV